MLRIPFKRATLVLVGVALGATLAARAQDAAHEVFRTRTDVVQVDVSVLDKNRRPVRGLTARDFSILEDGQERPIVAFSPVELPARMARPATMAPWVHDAPADVATNAIPPEGRLLVILFDSTIRWEDQALARSMARAAVDALGSENLGAVIYASHAVTAGTVQSLTTDKGRLLETINRPIAPTTVDRDMEPEAGAECGLCGLCGWDKVVQVADAVRSVPGRRKTMLFLTELQPDPSPLPADPCSEPVRVARLQVTRKTALANLTVHVLDPSGLEPLNTGISNGHGGGGYSNTGGGINLGTGGSLRNAAAVRHRVMPFLSNLTGGRFVMDDNTPEPRVRAIVDETSSYCLLGFMPQDSSNLAERAHRIQVKVTRRGVTVQARTSYQDEEVSPGRIPANAVSMDAAVRGTLPQSDVALSFGAAPFATPGATTGTVVMVLRVEPPVAASSDAADTAPHVAHAHIVAVDPMRGQVIGTMTQTAMIPAATSDRDANAYELLARFALPSGRYEIRAALDGGTARRGSVYGTIDIPNFEREPLAMSGIVLQTVPSTMAASTKLFDDLLPIQPTARRAFRATDRVTAFVRVYHAAASPPAQIRARLLDTTGRAVRDEIDPNSGADHRLDLPVGLLAPGEYLLEIEAVSGQHRVTRQIRFVRE